MDLHLHTQTTEGIVHSCGYAAKQLAAPCQNMTLSLHMYGSQYGFSLRVLRIFNCEKIQKVNHEVHTPHKIQPLTSSRCHS